ncbi:phosphonate ABC transporter, permease protein PhnE [Candidatus Viridilinea mediisalina]|uniref:Phosphonate ABC transporter, permease protein PhnE n=1 Tax=Candidatus Viridilinea mediisalina TaxID=2024553 RepID=A0A2A6RPU6_9CHLR|nr:phosphonate ABC transporter, permease protein PhnE [Candidatus Viridilinea mediisalina]PDW04953.1 phosphonate ABC transporter, permease protein PhnE [Candidatus Viridilinea mediisalina]
MPSDPLKLRQIQSIAFFAILAALTYGSIVITKYDVVQGFTAIPRAFSWATTHFIPDEAAWRRLPRILEKLFETILMAVSSATTASALGLVVALLGATTTRPHPWFSLPARGIASIFRNIDVSAWALILLFSFGQSTYTGFFALFFVTFGFIVRVMVETIDEVGMASVEALRATGANYLTIISQSVIPACLPQLISWVLYMIETNIRSATLVGILTGTGIGFSFDLYYKSMNYSSASLVVLVIVVAVLIIEALSNVIRRAVL